MTDDLRGALRALAPEPPEHLGLPETARGRARQIRRRRYAAATAFAVVAGLVVAAAAVLPDRTPLRPTGGGAAYPDWPRRGDAPLSADAEAVAAYDAYLAAMPSKPRRYADAQVLYSGSDGVAALRVVPTVGGRRVVVLTRGEDGRFAVRSDEPDPRGRVPYLVVAAGRSPLPPRDKPCEPPATLLRSEAVRLLVLGPPELDGPVRWQAGGPEGCDGAVALGDPHEFDLVDGAAVVDVPIAPAVTLHVRVGDRGEELAVPRPGKRPYHGVRVTGDVPRAPLGWLDRADSSLAAGLELDVANSDFDLEPYDDRCLPIWSAALPDGTETAVCTGVNAGDARPLALVSRTGDELRVHYEVGPQKPVTVLAAVVTGVQRWLLVVGPETLEEAELVDGAERRRIPLVNGSGWLALDREPSRDARVWLAGFARDGGAGIERGHETFTVSEPRRL